MKDVSKFEKKELGDGGVEITTTHNPWHRRVSKFFAIFVFIPFAVIPYVIFSSIIFDSFTVGTAFALGTLFAIFKWAAYVDKTRNGVKPARFRVSDKSITTENGNVLDKEDVAVVRIIAPRQSETTLHAGAIGATPAVGASSTRGVSARAASISWRVEAEAMGRTHILAGGLSEPVARAILHEFGKRGYQ